MFCLCSCLRDIQSHIQSQTLKGHFVYVIYKVNVYVIYKANVYVIYKVKIRLRDIQSQCLRDIQSQCLRDLRDIQRSMFT